MPCLVVLRADARADQAIPPSVADDAGRGDAQAEADPGAGLRLAMLVQAHADRAVVFHAGTNEATTYSNEAFAPLYAGRVVLLAPGVAALDDPDAGRSTDQRFGFRWFIPELLKHRGVWGQVIAASLAIQLLALCTPLLTQVVIDKVVVHRAQSTLVVVGVGLAIVTAFTALLGWVRQYLVLHTGNRVDAVLGASVFEHVLKLPPRYFEQRQTGVIVARLRGAETIREFIASAAITLVLDLPFLAIFVGIMIYYSVALTAVAVSLIAVIVALSLLVAPMFRARMNEQFLLGARVQAFTTEYVSGIETVKSLQLEPQLRDRYGDYLAEYLRSGFEVRQIANTYNVAANGIEQLMSLLILVIGAQFAMRGSAFTIGMLVAFQMFAARVSQPLLRLVGLWQQFQQARLSIERLGDVMNAPKEPYSVQPRRAPQRHGVVEVDGLGFRYGPNLPWLYEDFGLRLERGRVVALMGPSGSGKSTLAKLLQGFYLPEAGLIRIDGLDSRHLAANELRQYFGVVPQETTLFATTLYDNLRMANPMASFEQVVDACRAAEIHDTITALPEGYQTTVGERGAGLSTGQKQRIAIARALLKQPAVLIFDEATSSLDELTAEHLGQTINRLKQHASILFIAHALPTSLRVDELVYIGRADDPPAAKAGMSPGASRIPRSVAP